MLTDIPTISVNGWPIQADAISAEMQYHPATSRREAMVKSAQALIINEVVRQRAVALGIKSAQEGLDAIQEQALLEALMAKESEAPKATEQECRHFFEANKQKFSTAPLLEVRHILLAAPADSPQERQQARDQADILLSQLRQAPSVFAELAARYSACSSAKLGGNLGQISKGQTVPEFERQIFASPHGLMATPVESRYGFHLVDIVRRVEGHPLPYEQVKADIRQYLDTKVRRKHQAQYIRTLLAGADIQGFDFGLDGSPLMQ
ncbi:peptidylprolyl isomerase [Aliiglaciecola sp. CAU 1673]|uniref:peptidylprolyl isomerase n=1 Tax=Aliiglaciecola sp. CAU 1673 TaxID=3032595 RepID=UPI0023DABF55|nr:peptidylprolyl isomerase [Aliiglaciecola sp. CAU 1673]MDF2177412.1 peptidylprolyl isomerase [Aliiglaciecola sp. CAU 1673]